MKYRIVVLVVAVLLLAACMPITPEGTPATPAPEVANPAAVFCAEQGYTGEIRTAADGGQYGVCIFPDGTECDEWAYFRGECAPGTPAATPTPA